MTITERPVRRHCRLDAANTRRTPGAVVENYFPNAALAGSGTVEVRRNRAPIPEPTASTVGKTSTAGWSFENSAFDVSWAADSSVPGATGVLRVTGATYQGSGFGANLGSSVGAFTPSVTAGETITMSATVYVAIAGSITLTPRIYSHDAVHVISGATVTISAGQTVRISVTGVVPAGMTRALFRPLIWSVTDAALVARFRGALYERSPVVEPWFSATFSPDADLTASASGAQAILSGVPIAGVTAGNSVVIRSSSFGGSARIIPTGSSRDTFMQVTVPPTLRGGGTALGTVHLKSPVGESNSSRTRRIVSFLPEVNSGVPVPNVAGSIAQRYVFGAIDSYYVMRWYHGGSQGMGDVYWTGLGLFAGDYSGSAFSWNTPGTDDYEYSRSSADPAATSLRFQRWTDWTDKLTTIYTHRGGKQEGLVVQNDVGVLNFELRGVELDLADPEFIKGQIVRLSHMTGATRRDLFTGKVEEVLARPQITRRGRVVPLLQVSVVDAVAAHRGITRYGAIPPGGSETFAQRIARLAATATTPVEAPSGTFDTRLGRTVFESTLANHFTLACNTAGAMWWVGADGVTRFRPRKYTTTPIYFVNGANREGGTWPSNALHGIAEDAEGGSRYFYNTAIAHVLSAIDDPDNPGSWLADEYDAIAAQLSGSIARFGEQPVTVTVNDADNGTGGAHLGDWLIPFGSGGTVLRSITWNAQEDLARVPDLEIGQTVYTPGRNTHWNYVILGVHHTITPTRWLVQLDLGAITAPLM